VAHSDSDRCLYKFEFVVSHRVWLGREDRVGDDGVIVPGPALVYIDSDGMDGPPTRGLAAELIAAAELLQG
jgi:hypothetical protein